MEVLQLLEVEFIKTEPACESSVSEHAPLEDLYAGHTVKHELVIGPESLQQAQQRAPHTIKVTVKIENGESCEEELLNYSEQPNRGVIRGLPTNNYLMSIGEDTCKHYLSQKELFKLQNCFVKIDRMNFHKEQYTCKTCGKIFSQRSSRTYHMRSHAKKKTTAKKEISNATTKLTTKAATINVSSTSLKNHDIEKPHKCNVCRKQFKLKSQLVNHERTHTGEKPYSCRICSRGFSELSNLRKHERSHTGERPFSCEICKRQFALKCNLMDHIRIHTKERPYSCNLCCKQFRGYSTFRRHELLHTKHKKLTCDICGHQFVRKYRLIDHIRTHTMKKPYACEICSKQFGNKCNLRAHEKQHKEHYLCEICDEQFSEVFALKRHLLSHMAGPALG